MARVRNHLELGRLRVHLEKEVEKKTNELTRLNEALYNFIDMICHEIRNPLHGITGNRELISERLAANERIINNVLKDGISVEEEQAAINSNISEMKNYLNHIEECILYQTQVVEDAMFLSKMYSNEFDLSLSDCNPTKILDNIIQRFSFKLKKINVRAHIQSNITEEIRTDARCLYHILATLLIYSAENITGEGSTVEISQRLSTIDGGSRLTTRIMSNNLRIDPLQFAHLITLHQHSFKSRCVGSHYSNTAFGLAISNNLVKIMGGEAITILQEENGLVFTMNCSVVPKAVVDQQKQERIPTLKALVAEDNYINQVLCRCLLKKKGYECVIANTGREALVLYRPEAYDFILMDIAMPELDGIEVTRRIREIEAKEKASQHVYIIGLSAYAQPEKILEAMKAGMNDFVSKPATFDKIEDILKKWTGR